MIFCGLYGVVVKVKEEFWNVEIFKIFVINIIGFGDVIVGGFVYLLE